MKQYIDKSAVVAEIKRLMRTTFTNFDEGINAAAQTLLEIIDTLEVKEVDFEKEIQQHINDCLNIKFPTTDIKLIAKDVEYTARKFFELGVKAKEE